MSESADVTVTSLPKQKRFNITKQKAIKVGAAATGAVLGVLYLKRKLNCTCDASADVHVETADPTDN